MNVKLDLSDFNSIDEFSKIIKDNYSNIDALVNNACVYFMPKELTKQGYEITMGTNFLGPYYLTSSLIDLLIQNNSTIINVSSIVHKNAKIDFNDFFGNKVNRNRIYARSKLAITSFSYYLSEILKDKCIGCGECMRSCPAKTIVIKNKVAYIKKADCIKCFCCQELCPKDAVKVKKNPILKLVNL